MKKEHKDPHLDILKKGTVAVACHDAGATNIIINWLKVMPEIKFRAHLSGPAEDLWSSEFPDFTNFSLEDSLHGSSLMLSGTGWESNLEHNARLFASSLGIYSIAVVDHWVNYSSRFERDNKIMLPDEIWLIDQYGYNLAKSIFTKTTIKLLPNYYLDKKVQLIKKIQKKLINNTKNTNILIAMEPIRKQWTSNDSRAGEFQALDFIMRNINHITKNEINIRLRPHPSDFLGKYNDWINNQTNKRNINVSNDNSLEEDIAWSDIVLGCQTYVLIIALTVGKRVISCLPPYAPKSILPYPEIEELRVLTNGEL